MRFFYALLIRLHPPSFRKRFADEILWIYDEAANSLGVRALILDAMVSLLRGWLIRSELWKWVVAGIVGILPLMIAFGSFLPWSTPSGH